MVMGHVEILRAACCIAGIDGKVDEKEHVLLDQLARVSGVGRISLQAMIDRAQQDPDFYEEQFEILRTDPDHTLEALFAVGLADGQITTEQRIILHHFAERLGMSNQRFDELLAEAERKLIKDEG